MSVYINSNGGLKGIEGEGSGQQKKIKFSKIRFYQSTSHDKPNCFYGIKKSFFVVEIFNFEVSEI